MGNDVSRASVVIYLLLFFIGIGVYHRVGVDEMNLGG